jgi:hypothetical protein
MRDEDIDELVEASLLLKEIVCRRFGSFFFQSEMHEDLVTGLTGDAELPAQFRHRLAG